MEEPSTWLAATLPARAGAGADAAQVAATLAAILKEINAALVPSIGQPSITLIYQRSILLNAAAQPWLVGALENFHAEIDLAALRFTFAQQTSANAMAGGSAFLQSIYGLLVGFVGLSLTERLLRSVWANHPAGPAA